MEGMDRLRMFLDRRTAVSFIASTDLQGRPEVSILVAARLTPDGRLAGGEEESVSGRTFRNLRQNPRATILVLDPVMDPRARDGVRLDAEFLGAEDAGQELDHLSAWLSSVAPGRRVTRRLHFKVLEIEAYRPPAESPVIQG